MNYDSFYDTTRKLADNICSNIYLSNADKEKEIWRFVKDINNVIWYLKDVNEYNITKIMYKEMVEQDIVSREDMNWQLSAIEEQIRHRKYTASKSYKRAREVCKKHYVKFNIDKDILNLLKDLL